MRSRLDPLAAGLAAGSAAARLIGARAWCLPAAGRIVTPGRARALGGSRGGIGRGLGPADSGMRVFHGSH
jgi:hypothetical protein